MSRPTPETKWYVTEYPEECSFAITDGNEILVTIIGGNTIGDQCDLASRIAKLPDLERERDELQDALEHAQMTIGSIVSPSDKATLELIKVTKERDEAREEIRDWKRLHDAAERGVDLTIAEGTISDLLKQRDEARLEAAMWALQRDEARELVYAWESRWKAEVEFACRVSIKCDELLGILRKLLEIIPEPECHDFGHTKEERHAFLEECPVMARYDALIAQAKEATK